jgi:hypothetical protein
MPYGVGRMMRLRLRGGGLPGCPGNRFPLGRGILGTAISIAAGLVLNDLSNPDGLIRGNARKLLSKGNSYMAKKDAAKLITKE